MSKTLSQISKSPFTRRIVRAELPKRFTQPTFTVYNEKIDPIEHVSHFNQKMTIYTRNEALLCKVFPSSLVLVAMRWFDGLHERFVTCRRVSRTLDSLLALSMREKYCSKLFLRAI